MYVYLTELSTKYITYLLNIIISFYLSIVKVAYIKGIMCRRDKAKCEDVGVHPLLLLRSERRRL